MRLRDAQTSLKTVLPEEAWRLARDAVYWTRKYRHKFERQPPVGWVRFGSFRRVQPIDPGFGFRWGHVIVRYCIERFLGQHVASIYGLLLEVADNGYTQHFGGKRWRNRSEYSGPS